jgi:hypothetical protein
VSQNDADTKAQTDVQTNGQNYANTNGICTFKNVMKSVTYTKNNCAPAGYGSEVNYTVAAGKYTSTVSQADADAQTIPEFNANGQANANTKGFCTFKSRALVSFGLYKNNCLAPKVGSYVLYSASMGAFTSTISQTDADEKAWAAAQTNANVRGTCK